MEEPDFQRRGALHAAIDARHAAVVAVLSRPLDQWPLGRALGVSRRVPCCVMHDALTTYFNGEKYAGLILAGMAICAMVVAGLLFRAGAGFRSFAITLGILALAEIALGVGLYARTGPQVRNLEGQLQSDATSFYTTESARMRRVQRNFVVVEYVELAVIITAALVAVAAKGRPGVSGIALGLLINASLLLAFDVLAERRGAEYMEALVATNR